MSQCSTRSVLGPRSANYSNIDTPRARRRSLRRRNSNTVPVIAVPITDAMGRAKGSFLDSSILPAPVVSAVDFIVDMAQFFFPSLFLACIDCECPSQRIALPECLLGLKRPWFSPSASSVSDEPGDTFGFDHNRCATCACQCQCCISRYCADLVWRANIGTNTVAGLKGVSRDVVDDTLGLVGAAMACPPPPEKISDKMLIHDDHAQVAEGGGAQSHIENSRRAAAPVASDISGPTHAGDNQLAYIQKLERRIRKLELVNQLVEDAYYEVSQQLAAERQSKIFMRKVMTLQHDQDMETLVKSLQENMAAASDDEDGKHPAFVIPGSGSDQEFSDTDSASFHVKLGFQMEPRKTPPHLPLLHSSPILHTTSDLSPPPSIRRSASDSTKVMLPGDLGIDFLTTAWEVDEEDSDVDVQFDQPESQLEEAVTDDNDDAWESEESEDDSDIDEDDDDDNAHELQIEFMSVPAHAIDAESSDDDADTEESDNESEASEDVDSDEDEDSHDITISFEGFHHDPSTGEDATMEWEIHSEGESETTDSRRYSISDDEALSGSDFDSVDFGAPPPAVLATPRARTPIWRAAASEVESSDEAELSDDGAKAVDPVKAVIDRYYARTGILDLAADIDDITITEDDSEGEAESPDEDFIRRHTQRQREQSQSQPQSSAGDIMGITEADGSVQERIATLPVDQRIAKFICRASSHLLQGARGGLNPGFMMNNIQELAAEFGSTHESVLCAFIESLYRLVESTADYSASDAVAKAVADVQEAAASRDEIGSPLQAVMRIVKLFHAFIVRQSDQDTVLRQLERLSLANQRARLAKHAVLLRIMYESELIDKSPIVQWYESPESSDGEDDALAAEIREHASPLIDEISSSDEQLHFSSMPNLLSPVSDESTTLNSQSSDSESAPSGIIHDFGVMHSNGSGMLDAHASGTLDAARS
ncbi:hypothetical protein DL89DRAFT_269912 [Linderina pennispora]|uniref:W2 domain-containing protein n=1 Tax=Linderina pennispora TaxID=61395 RepID=A0A1Y1W032_9FUNG|nr:uncharacterized protein DL89DRAFT_269912 [Linderina pennispora]ORX66871.1 hypothetical protein DL89DRAFT_269912 [Linderina pennispora]